MKSERRHELQHNALADWISRNFERIRPYQTTVLGLVLLVLLAIMGVVLLKQHYSSQDADDWRKLTNNDLVALNELAEKQPGTPIGSLAGVLAGDHYLGEGGQQRFINRATANKQLAQAADFYRHVLDASPVPMLRERAAFGLARALESQGDQEGKLAEALKVYNKIITEWPDGAYVVAAKERIKDLERPETKVFYDQFAKFDPRPSYSGAAGSPTRSSLSDPNSLAEPPESKGLRDDSPFQRLNLEEKEKKSSTPEDKGAKDKTPGNK